MYRTKFNHEFRPIIFDISYISFREDLNTRDTRSPLRIIFAIFPHYGKSFHVVLRRVITRGHECGLAFSLDRGATDHTHGKSRASLVPDIFNFLFFHLSPFSILGINSLWFAKRLSHELHVYTSVICKFNRGQRAVHLYFPPARSNSLPVIIAKYLLIFVILRGKRENRTKRKPRAAKTTGSRTQNLPRNSDIIYYISL